MNKYIKIIITSLIIFTFNQTFSQSKLSVHGHLSQAFAISDGNQIFGIPKESTFDYRTLALQFRYDINESNSTIIQFSHRRIGLSPLMELESDINLDWAFYEHRFNENAGVKFGKILIPFGLYNEIRDVGVLLPFFRVPFVPYSMGTYLSETVNGFSAYYNFNYYNTKQIEFDVYAGSWSWLGWVNLQNPISDDLITIVDEAQAANGLGLRMLINSPIQGVDFITSWQRGEVSGGVFFHKNIDGIRPQTYNSYDFAIDASFSGFFIMPEFVAIYLSPGDLYIHGIANQMGCEILDGLLINFSTELIIIRDVPKYKSSNSNMVIERMNSDYLQDHAIGITYKFNSNLVLKTELHWNKSLVAENIFLNAFDDEAINTTFLIVSLATSF